ncbi:MAG: DUF4145 domain-containing protein [Rickettsiales bacterium]|nr:DUF4145 domain-containing protein [Rickettsiales bacterium]
MEKNYVAPSTKLTAFHCPHCGTKSSHTWYNAYANSVGSIDGVPYILRLKEIEQVIKNIKAEQTKEVLTDEQMQKWIKEAQLCEAGELVFESCQYTTMSNKLSNVFYSVCKEVSCRKASLWIGVRIVYPSISVEEQPNDDMPEHIKAIYNEARSIHSLSPRAAAALLRLCCELLCKYLDAKGSNFNEQIADLVKKGMDTRVQMTLDIVRFTGNSAIHPGQIDDLDDLTTSHTLFLLVNEIVQEMISKPKRLEKLYTERLPEKVREGIAKRDKTSVEA